MVVIAEAVVESEMIELVLNFADDSTLVGVRSEELFFVVLF